jgi:hypothetical protein
MCLFFLGVLLGISLIGFFSLIGFIGVYGIFTYLIEHCPVILVGSGLFAMGLVFVVIGWGIFCKFADKLKDS